MIPMHDHNQLQDTIRRWIPEEINPHVDEQERAERLPAH
jgi:citronellyl-CoA dehydrogenase